MKFLRNNLHNLLGLIVFLILFFAVVSLQYKYDKIVHPYVTFAYETHYVMPASLVKNFSFGFKNVMADFYWIGIIQDFSIWNGSDSFYLRKFENLSVLDPHFSYPYLLGILTVTSRSTKYDPASPATVTIYDIEPIATLGLKNNPKSWEIPFYLGTAFQITKAPEKALQYLKIASEIEGAPDFTKRAYDSYSKNVSKGDNVSQALIKIIYETTESKTTKKILKEGMIARDLTRVIQGVVTEYRLKYKKYPSSFNDLVVTHMVQNTDKVESEFTIMIDSKTGIVTVTPKDN